MALDVHDITSLLRSDILSERIKPGGKLTEESVASRFGVSRTPVREALRMLESEGLTELVPNRGVYVIGFTRSDIRDIFSLRCRLEELAAAWATERYYPEEIEKLETQFETMKVYTAGKDLTRSRELNAEFHELIAAMAHSSKLANMLSLCSAYTKESALCRECTEADMDIILEEHAAILDAMFAGEPDEASRAMSIHIKQAAGRAGF